MDKEIICNFENLYRAYKKAKAGKKYNGSAARFQMMTLEGVHILKEQLENQSYKVSPYNEFQIYEPKQRVIKSCNFKDKVVQHCFCDNVIMPRLSRVLIKENYAGQIGKGTLYGMESLKEQMLSYYHENGIEGWILKCDISKYFYSIDHEKLKDIIDYYFSEPYVGWLNRVFIDSTDSPGVPLGNQVAQAYALLMLHGIDCMITGQLGIKYYGRYMDDFYLFCRSKEYLKDCLDAITAFVESLNLKLNGKTQIIPFRKGIGFLGFHHYITSDGKYIRKLKGENKRRAKKRVTRWLRAAETGRMSEKKFKEKYGAWKNHALHGNCIKLCRNMDLYVESKLKTKKVKE